MSTGSNTNRRFEDRHPDLWDEVQVMIESDQSQSAGRSEAPSIFTRFFRGGDFIRRTARRARPERDT